MSFTSSARVAGPFNGNDSTVVFAFTFKVFSTADVRVVKTDTSGVEADQTLTTHYSVALNADQNVSPGGTITMVTAPVSGEKLTLSSKVGNTQPLVIRNQSAYYPKNLEEALDRGVILTQQLAGTVGRSLQIPISDGTSLVAELPTAALRANKAIVFDASGNVGVSADDYEDQATNTAANAAAAAASATNAAASEAATAADAVATAADRVQTGLDATATAADAVATAADRVQTGLDATATAADAVATAADRVQTGLDATAAAASAAAAAASSAEGLYNDVASKSFADSPLVPLAAEEGTLFRIDTSGGNVVVNLSSLATYAEDMKFAFVKTTSDANTITINRGGTDTIQGGTSVTITTQYEVNVMIGDSATGTWVRSVQSATLADGSVTTTKLADASVTYAKIQDTSTYNRLIGRKTASAGSVEELTITDALNFVSTTQGALLQRGSSTWFATTPGTDGYVLRTNGAGAYASWDSVQNILSEDATTAITPTTSDHVFVQDASAGDAVKRVSLADLQTLIGGTKTLISSGTLSGSATADFSLSSSYSYYLMEIEKFIPTVDGVVISALFSTDGGSTFLSSGYMWSSKSSSSASYWRNASDTKIQPFYVGATEADTTEAIKGRMYVYSPAVAERAATNVVWHVHCPDRVNNFVGSVHGSGTNVTTSAVNALRLSVASGTFTLKYKLYGVA